MLDHVQPDIIWNDFALDSPGYCRGGSDSCAIGEQARLDFLAYYFNRGVEWGKEVLTTYKHFDYGFRDTSAVADYERGGPADITRPYWLTDEAISASSWSYTDGIKYCNSVSMIHSLLDRVAKNGNVLLNVSPTAAGVLPDEQAKVLRDIGDYLRHYGESIYNTRAWDIHEEGPNKAGGGSFTAPLVGNCSDIRFTSNKDANVLYATVLGWPQDGLVSITNLGSYALVTLDNLASIQLLGDETGQYTDVTSWEQTKEALNIELPSQPAESFAYVLKLSFDGSIPVPQPKRGAAVFIAKGDVRGVTLGGEGDFREVFLTEADLEPHLIRFIRVSEGSKLTVYSNGDLSGDSREYNAGEHEIEKGSIGSIRITEA